MFELKPLTMASKNLAQIVGAGAIVTLLYIGMCAETPDLKRADKNAPLSDPWARTITNRVRELNSAASALFELAGERFARNEKQGRTWILTLYDPTKHFGVLKYTDGKIMVVALPVMSQGDELGLRRYVDHYNSYNVRSADLKVKAGNYEQARELYTLLLHFDPHGSLAEGVRQRLSHLKKIEKGEDREQNLERLMSLSEDLAPSFMAGIDDAPAVKVKNLLEISVDQ